MPLYYFDMNGEGGSFPDDVGSNYPTDEAAKLAAVRLLPAILGDVIQTDREISLEVLVRDADGTVMFKADLILTSGDVTGR